MAPISWPRVRKRGEFRRRLAKSVLCGRRERNALRPGDKAKAQDASEAVRAIAWKAQKRLHARYHRLISRGKSAQTAITAVAREQLGFIWAIGLEVMAEQRALAARG